MEITLAPEVREALKREFITALKDSGLVWVSKDVAEHGVAFLAKQDDLLKQKTITPYMVAKYKLLPGVTHLQTVKNMVADGRIRKGEWLLDADEKLQILTYAIKRIRDGR